LLLVGFCFFVFFVGCWLVGWLVGWKWHLDARLVAVPVGWDGELRPEEGDALRPTPHTLHPTPYTLHPTPYTLHPTPHTLHPTPYPSLYTLHTRSHLDPCLVAVPVGGDGELRPEEGDGGEPLVERRVEVVHVLPAQIRQSDCHGTHKTVRLSRHT